MRLPVSQAPAACQVAAPRRRRHIYQRLTVSCSSGPSTRLFVARKFAIDVGEDGAPGRRAKDYVRLPADRYNVLDSRAVQRVEGKEGTFRVSTGVQRMLMFEAEPVGYISIEVKPDGVEQKLIGAELLPVGKPSSLVDEINATLNNVQLTNTVTARPLPGGRAQLVCQLELRGAFTRGVLSKVPEARLNGLMSWALGALMPWFLTKLRSDYRSWAAGESRTEALGTGEIATLARALMSGKAALPEGLIELAVDDARLAGALVAPLMPTGEETGEEATARPAASPTAGRGFKR